MVDEVKTTYIEGSDVEMVKRGFMDVKISSSVSSFDRNDLSKENKSTYETTFVVKQKSEPRHIDLNFVLSNEENK